MTELDKQLAESREDGNDSEVKEIISPKLTEITGNREEYLLLTEEESKKRLEQIRANLL